MRLIIFLLALALLIGGAEASTLINATSAVDFSHGIPNLKNGTAAQDAATYSQAVMLSTESIITVGAYNWCDYVTDHSADQIEANTAIVAAEGEKRVVFVGDLTLSYPINVTTNNTWLDGTFMSIRGTEGKGTWLLLGSATQNGITITNANCRISNIQIKPAAGVTPSAGYGIYSTDSFVTIENVYGLGLCNGIGTLRGYVWWEDIALVNTLKINYALNAAGDATLLNLACDAGIAQTSSMKGLYVYGGVSNLEASNLELQHAGYCLVIDGLYAGDFVNCKFDNGIYSNTIRSTSSESRHIHFSNSWFTTLGTIGAAAGLDIAGSNVWDVTVSGFTVRDTGGHGMVVGGGARNVTISSGTIYNIGTYEGSHGIVIVDGKSTKITNVNFIDGSTGVMAYSIGMITASRPICMGNSLGGVARYGSGTNEIWEHNIA